MLAPGDILDDAKLAEQIREGSSQTRLDAFDQLIRRYGERLQRYLATKGLSRQEREDVAGEAWTRAWQGLDRYEYREEAGFFPWLRSIADNVIREFTRKHYLAHGSEALSPDLEEAFADESATDTALVHLTREEMHKTIKGILPEAPNDDWRIAIEAHLVDGWQTDEIMELYGWSRNKVYVTKFRAFAWLKTRLLEQVGPTNIEAWLGDP